MTDLVVPDDIDFSAYVDEGDRAEQSAAEEAVLGALLFDNKARAKLPAEFSASAFGFAQHQSIYRAICAVIDAGSEADVITVAERLDRVGRLEGCGGRLRLDELARQAPLTTRNIAAHAQVVLDRAASRAEAELRHQAAVALRQGAEPDEVAAIIARIGKPRSQLLRQLEYVVASDLPDDDDSFDDELVEGVIGKAAMAVLYGDSNSGKTFLAVELAACVALATDWLGRRAAGGLVVYLATEASASVVLRVRARQRRYGQTIPGLVVVKSPLNFFDGEADITALIALIDDIEKRLQGKVTLIIGDTLARMSTGANENSGDMGVVMMHADALRNATGATFLWIHHSGKNAAQGMRGWSGIRAAIDTEIEVTADEATGIRTAEITKQRDLPGKGDRIGFTLAPVSMGRNQWGTERSSCVVLPVDAPDRPAVRAKRPSEIAGAITEYLRNRGSGCLKGAMVKHFDGTYTSSAVYKALRNMVADGMLIDSAGVVALPGKPGVNP